MTAQGETAALLTLEREHVLISRVLSVMEDQVRLIDDGIMPRCELINLVAGFFSAFADRRHHDKEELYLFPLLAAKKDVIRDGPIKVLNAEHQSGRYFVSELRQGTGQLTAGDLAGAQRIRQALALYARMLRKHIAKEEQIVFLLTRALLSAEEQDGLNKAFNQADAAGGDANLEKAGELVWRIEELNRDPAQGNSSPTRYPAAS